MHWGNMNIPDTTKANTGTFVFTAQRESNVVSTLSIETNTRVVRINSIDNIDMSMNTITHINNKDNVISPSYQLSVTNASLPDATDMAIAAKQFCQNIVLSSIVESNTKDMNTINRNSSNNDNNINQITSSNNNTACNNENNGKIETRMI